MKGTYCRATASSSLVAYVALAKKTRMLSFAHFLGSLAPPLGIPQCAVELLSLLPAPHQHLLARRLL
eukprot:9495132-Pyramimonas_sp.AAC.3